MSDAYLVRRGGSGGLSPNSAVLYVTAPAGSTITFAKGGVTVKVLGPDKSHVNSDNSTLAYWYYAVSPGNYGAWAVTATLGQDTAANTVTVDSNKQYDVFLSFNFYLARNGVLQSGYSLYGSGNTISQKSGYIYTAYSGGNTGACAHIGILPDISFNYLVLKTSGGKVLQNSNFDKFGIGSKSANSFSTGKQFGAYNAVEVKTWVLDVSRTALKDKYFTIALYGSGAYLNITDVYFAKEAPT